MIGGRGTSDLVLPPASAFVALAGLVLVGVSLDTAAATGAACAAILLFGMPHGTLDLAIVRRERHLDAAAMRPLLAAYLGLAAAMLWLWSIAPVAALVAFLAVSVVHFADDWNEVGSSFLAHAVAASILTAPALLHLPSLEALFVTLAGTPDAAVVAEMLLLLAPASLMIAVVALIALWQSGRRDQAIAGAAVLATMTLFAPVVAFAAFFCLYHSPRHLREALARLDRPSVARRSIALLTLAALGIVAGLYAWGARGDWSAQLVAASFKTLSLLTIPHMIIPAIVMAVAARSPTIVDRQRWRARAPA